MTVAPQPSSDSHPSTRRTILFDLDGTLVDSAADIAASLNHALTHAGLAPYDEADVRHMIGDGAAELLARAFRDRSAPEPPDALARFKAHYGDHCLDATRPYPGVPELLRVLARREPVAASICVITNKPSAFAEKLVDALDLGRFIGVVVGPDQVSERKPSAIHVLAALERLNATPADAVVVGDGTTDVLAGRAAGASTVAVLWGYRSRERLEEARPDYIVETPAALAGLLGVPLASSS